MAVLALLLNQSEASVPDYENGLGGNAPCVESYVGVWESESVGYDPHATHGLQAQDGGTVAVGMGGTTESATTAQGFALKTKGCQHAYTYLNLSANGSTCDETWDWVTKVGYEALWVAESPDGSYFIVAGTKRPTSSTNIMNIAKLNSSDGAIVWEMTYGTMSGVETVAFTSDGGFVVGGYLDTSYLPEGYKSGGQVENGTPFVGKISASDAQGSSAPAGFEWMYTNTDQAYTGSAKAIRVDSQDNVFVLAGIKIAAIKLDSSGSELWNTGELDATAQMNDLEHAPDGGLVLTGQKITQTTTGCSASSCSIIKGHMMKLSSTGSVEWTKDFGNYPGGKNQYTGLGVGEDVLIYNECWGIAPRYEGTSTTQIGYVIACGTGIEGCDSYLDSATMDKCNADPRRDWRALTFATDLNGDRVYSRMDNYQTEEATVWSSAAEYVFPAAGGKITVITDEAMGFGIMTLSTFDDVICIGSPVYQPSAEDFASNISYSTYALAAALIASIF